MRFSENEQNVYIYEPVSTNVCALLEQLLSGGQSRLQRAQQQPGSPRKCCSSLLTAMKSNQSLAFSPGLTSAFNYRTQQPQQQHRERLPPLGRSQHVTAQTLGCRPDMKCPGKVESVLTSYRMTGAEVSARTIVRRQTSSRAPGKPSPNPKQDVKS